MFYYSFLQLLIDIIKFHLTFEKKRLFRIVLVVCFYDK